MKRHSVCYSILALALSACQYLPAEKKVEEPIQQKVQEVSELEQIIQYGAEFATEYKQDKKQACAKYLKLYEQGDWRAGWVLALQSDPTKALPCLKTKESVQILKELESKNQINPDLLWLNQAYLRLLDKQRKQTKKIRWYRSSVSRHKKQINALKKQNKNQLEKLEALKAIETSINN